MSRSHLQRQDAALQAKAEHEPVAGAETAAPATDNAAAASEAHAARGFEGSFGADLSGVQVHRDGLADQMGAQAFAQGENIHLAAGAPAADTKEGRALLGHEVAHVMQQRQGRVDAPQGKGAPVVADAALEAEADTVGAAVARGEPAPASMQGVGAGGTSAMQGKAEGAPIQMFGALEHKTMGDQGGGNIFRWDTATEAAAGKRDVNYGFTMTHGDIVMLSGDLFDARETDADGNPIPDNLFKLARTPGNNGDVVGTQDEIMYAIYKEKPHDIRFKNICINPSAKQDDGSPVPPVTFPLKPEDPSKMFSPPHFSEEVKKTVDNRYLNLAAKNRDHFVDPDGKMGGGPDRKDKRSAGGSYRAMHESAIKAAFDAGQRGESVDEALAYEAAAQHYLTDAFASGHLRTPTGSIKSHWDAIYPNFWPNLKGFIAHQMAVNINADDFDLATLVGTVAKIEDDVRGTLEEKVAGLPELGFERLVALATHDVDNEEGVKVINDLGERWTAYGDSQMKKPGKGASQEKAIEAIKLGCDDIKEAHTMPMLIVDPCASLMVGDKYKSEQKMPRIDPEFETSKLDGWNASDIDDLWDNKIRSDNELTYGKELEASAAGGDIASQIGGMADMIDEEQEVWVDTLGDYQMFAGTVHPKRAFIKGVANPIQTATKSTLKRIINYDPSTGHVFFNEDDAVMEEMDRMDSRDKAAGKKDGESLRALTLDQRAQWIENIMGGTFSVVFEDEEERIAQIFETCRAGDRPRLYRMIEGHEWEGDFRNGIFTWDDDLYNSLSGAELRKVRELINEGM